MSNYFYASLGSGELPVLSMTPINKGDNNLYLRVSGNTILSPGSKIKAIIVPSGITTLPNPLESFSIPKLINRLNSDQFYSDTTYGVFSVLGGENNSDSDHNAIFNDVMINDFYFENQSFELHWIYKKGIYDYYGSISGISTFPHNIQNDEISISGLLTSNNVMRYCVKWNSITNEGIGYSSPPNDGPYRFKVNYAWNSGIVIPSLSDWVYYDSGTMNSGITFDLPYYDSRTTTTPAIYNFYLSNVSNTVIKPGTSDKIILIDHQKFIDSENYFKNLDDQTFTSPNPDKLNKVGTIEIEPGIIDRKRISIGINDISIKENTYIKQGTYVSIYYPLDFNLYTLSIRSIEYIPEYNNIYKYDVIKYYIEVNSKWERISPINRGDEISENVIVPKILVFDKGQSNNNQVKYIDISNVKIFRVKIVFDLNNLTESKFIPPEVLDYKCIVFDKDKLNEL
jgi:hypothetical protein